MLTNEEALEQAPTQLPALETELDEDSIVSSLVRLQELQISVWHDRPIETILRVNITNHMPCSFVTFVGQFQKSWIRFSSIQSPQTSCTQISLK